MHHPWANVLEGLVVGAGLHDVPCDVRHPIADAFEATMHLGGFDVATGGENAFERRAWRPGLAAGEGRHILRPGTLPGLMRMFTRRGVLVGDMGQTWLAEPAAEGEKARTLRPLQAAAVAYRIAFGPCTGRRMLTLRGAAQYEAAARQPLCNTLGSALWATPLSTPFKKRDRGWGVSQNPGSVGCRIYLRQWARRATRLRSCSAVVQEVRRPRQR